MEEDVLIELWINLFVIIALDAVLLPLLLRYVRHKHIVPHLTLALLIMDISQVFYIFSLLMLEFGIYLRYVAYILSIFPYYFIYLHFEALSSPRLTTWRQSFILAFAFICLTFIMPYFFNLYNDLRFTDSMIEILTYLFGITCLLICLNVALNTNRLVKERATRIELMSIILILFGHLVSLYAFISQINSSDIIAISGYILIILGLMLFASNYIIHKNYIYRLPFPVHQIMVINKAGILAYSRSVSVISIPDLDDTKEFLVSGLLTAIKGLIAETLGSDTRIKFVDTTKYKIFFSEIPNKGGIITIISSGGTYYLKRSLKLFSLSITPEMYKQIQDPDQKESLIESIDCLILNAFPYLELIK